MDGIDQTVILPADWQEFLNQPGDMLTNPSTLTLLAIGMLCYAIFGRRRSRPLRSETTGNQQLPPQQSEPPRRAA